MAVSGSRLFLDMKQICFLDICQMRILLHFHARAGGSPSLPKQTPVAKTLMDEISDDEEPLTPHLKTR